MSQAQAIEIMRLREDAKNLRISLEETRKELVSVWGELKRLQQEMAALKGTRKNAA